jgi:2-methylcitrate dehydratase PrpD
MPLDPLDGEPVIDRLCRFTTGVGFQDLPDHVVAYAQDLMLDTLGVAAPAAGTDAGRIARDVAATLFAAGAGETPARLLFDGRPASAAGAAYAGAVQIDNLDGHDGFGPAKGHIGAAVLPALLAVAQTVPAVSGRDALVCLALGYEIASRAGLALHATVADYHTSGAWNALAVAALGSRLRGLDAGRLQHAFGIAEYHGPRSQMMREVDNPTMLHDGSGWGALAGTAAVFLAERGFTGAPAITVEGANVAEYWADLGQRWLTTEQYIKPYPVCRWAHPMIDGALHLRAEHDLAAEDVAAVELTTFHESTRLAAGVPENTAQAQYSLPFPVAAALARGRCGVDEVMGSGLTDPAIARLVGVTAVAESEKYNARFPEGRWGEITLVLADGRRLSSGEINARGGPDQPLSRDEVVAKFRAFAEPAIGAARARAIEDAVFALNETDADLGGLMDLATAPADG